MPKDFCTCVGACACNCMSLLKRPGLGCGGVGVIEHIFKFWMDATNEDDNSRSGVRRVHAAPTMVKVMANYNGYYYCTLLISRIIT